MTRRWPKK